jgi:hypothetical protein
VVSSFLLVVFTDTSKAGHSTMSVSARKLQFILLPFSNISLQKSSS